MHDRAHLGRIDFPLQNYFPRAFPLLSIHRNRPTVRPVSSEITDFSYAKIVPERNEFFQHALTSIALSAPTLHQSQVYACPGRVAPKYNKGSRQPEFIPHQLYRVSARKAVSLVA